MHSAPKSIYLAGPEVFLPDAKSHGAVKVELCRKAGFSGFFPLDQSLDLRGLAKPEQARRISLANEALMRSADLLIANLTPFRGASMDAGTAFEVGFMRALGRPVLGYTNAPDDYAVRARQYRARGYAPDDCDRADIEVEDFNLAENLMIAVAIADSGSRVIRTRVAPGNAMTDLAGFVACLEEARRLIPSGS